MLIAVPFGIGAAVFVSEFCSRRVKESLKVVIELLAAIPSVVWGFIGISVMNPLIQDVFHVPIGLNVLNGALLLALMSVPIMVSIGEDALKAVPDSFREAAIALGATRWQVVYKVLLPAAKNGLLAAVLLGVGRAVGETMAVLMATGHAINIPHSVFDPVRTLTATIAAELGEASVGSAHYQVLFLVGILLFSITFVVNLSADLIVKGVKKG
jgi:phosphate transport system permease protein